MRVTHNIRRIGAVCCAGVLLYCFFFFKQKTAYEIKECDWSSDVCSSDLEKNIPKHKHYLERSKQTPGKLIKRWNLIVPEKVLSQQWEEPNEIF